MAEPAVRTALVTGASSGLGAEFARQLAAAGSHVILVARRKERLEALAAELEGRHGVKAEPFPADLSKNEDLARVADRIRAAEDLDLLVNNAGFGERERFAKGEIGPRLVMLRVHVTASVVLSRAALEGMVSRKRGTIINVSSLAAFAPFGWTMYGATKAFLVSFSQNLNYELAGTGVRVQALCPGFFYTEFHDVIEMDRSAYPGFMWMAAADVARTSLKALGRDKPVCIPGLGNRLIAVSLRCPPLAGLIRAAARLRWLRRKLTR